MNHARFADLAAHLTPGDLLVVNTSATMPAAVDGEWHRGDVTVHFSTRHEDASWTIELRLPDGSGPVLDARRGDTISLHAGRLELRCPADAGDVGHVRLWRARVNVRGGLRRYLDRHGRPIRYAYTPTRWPLSAYQTLFADRRRWPSSAEMPSAARPFSPALVGRLTRAGIRIATVELHAGVSSQEANEAPQPEPFMVSARTARAVCEAHDRGARVIAVGTTVARALETAGGPNGVVTSGCGWTDLVLGPERPARAIDGIISGWHPPEASHIRLLEAVVGRDMVVAAYGEALAKSYLWHEFGDSCLLIAGSRQGSD